MKLRNKLSKKGISNLISIEIGFRNIDTENEQEIDFSTFKIACEKFNFELSEKECKELFLSFTEENSLKLNYDEFLRSLRGEIPEKRKELVEKIFRNINRGNQGGLLIGELMLIYEPKGSYEYLYKKQNEGIAKKIFENTFKENHLYLNGEDGVDKLVDKDEFIDYYESVSLMISDDDIFNEIMLKSWGIMPLDEDFIKEESKKDIYKKNFQKEKKKFKNEDNLREENEEKRYGKLYEKGKQFQKNLLKEQNIDFFRNILGAKGIRTVINFLNQLIQYDRAGDKELSFQEFFEIIKNLKLNISEKNSKLVFSDFSENSAINYDYFLSSLIDNSLNKRRYNIVKEAFKKLDIEECGVVDMSEIKFQFSSKNSPLVREGYMTEGEFYSDFMESFQTHYNLFKNSRIKKINFEEFLDYYKYYSITIEEDELFEEILIYCWKLSKPKIWNTSQKNNAKKIIRSTDLESPNKNEIIKNISLEEKNPIGKNYFPESSKDSPYGIDNEINYYKINKNKNEDPISILRTKIFARGPRSIMSLRRTFMLFDEDKSKRLRYKQFDKFIKDYRLDLSNEEKKNLFRIFDKNNSGIINYEKLINRLVGKMNNYRTKMIGKVFDKLDKEKIGKVSFDTVINSYDPYMHPEVLKGERNAQEVLCMFIDLFEYHFNLLDPDKDNEEITKEEFIEFYNYISPYFDDDKIFESVISRVWGLIEDEKYRKLNYGKKYY